VRRAHYQVAVPSERHAGLRTRVSALLAAPECWIERTRPHTRRFDLRPYLSDLHLGEEFLQMVLWVTPNGAARPEEVLEQLGLADLVQAGAVIERTYLELHDEVTAGTDAGTAVVPAAARPVSDQIPITEPSAIDRDGPMKGMA
jgi:hypothetical protein